MSTYYVEDSVLVDVGSFPYRELRSPSKWFSHIGYTKVECPDLLGGSDYSGDILQKSNYEAFFEQFSGIDGVYSVYGGHGTFAIALTEEALANEEIRDCLAGLEDYSAIDDTLLYAMEEDAYLESWSNYGASDFRGKLKNDFLANHFLTRCSDYLDSLDDDTLREFFESLIESNCYYHSETQNSVYIYLDEAVNSCTVAKLAQFIKAQRKAEQNEQ